MGAHGPIISSKNGIWKCKSFPYSNTNHMNGSLSMPWPFPSTSHRSLKEHIIRMFRNDLEANMHYERVSCQPPRLLEFGIQRRRSPTMYNVPCNTLGSRLLLQWNQMALEAWTHKTAPTRPESSKMNKLKGEDCDAPHTIRSSSYISRLYVLKNSWHPHPRSTNIPPKFLRTTLYYIYTMIQVIDPCRIWNCNYSNNWEICDHLRRWNGTNVRQEPAVSYKWNEPVEVEV